MGVYVWVGVSAIEAVFVNICSFAIYDNNVPDDIFYPQPCVLLLVQQPAIQLQIDQAKKGEEQVKHGNFLTLYACSWVLELPYQESADTAESS